MLDGRRLSCTKDASDHGASRLVDSRIRQLRCWIFLRALRSLAHAGTIDTPTQKETATWILPCRDRILLVLMHASRFGDGCDLSHWTYVQLGGDVKK